MAALAEEDRDGDTPDALARNTPVRPRRDHVRDTFLAPRRVPLGRLDLVQSALAQRARSDLRFHADEPLLRRPKDHGIVTAPAMRIRMLDVLAMHEYRAALQQFDDRLVRLED